MKEKRVLVTVEDIQRYKVLNDVVAKKLKGIEAAQILNLSTVHISRLKQRLLKDSLEGLLRKSPSSPPSNKISEATIEEILSLHKEFYYDFNVMHFMDKLHEVHKMPYCYESIRQILIKNNLHNPKKKKKVYRKRRRMPKAGMLVQMDSSQHQWLAHIPDKWWMVNMIDDATSEIPYAQFFPSDTLFANMHVIRRFIELKGLFMALYADKASHFKTTRHGGLHYDVSPEQEDTQIERALKELGITLIPAGSCQAKGRVEVSFKLFQDRLIKEMRLAGIKNYTQANRFMVKEFLPWRNAKYTHPAESAYMSLPKDKNLDTIFCIKKDRRVNNDNTVKIDNQIIQIPPSDIHLSFARRKVDVCTLENKRIFVLYKDSIICESKLSKSNKIHKKEKQIETLLNNREYAFDVKKTPAALFIISRVKNKHVPSPDHPWRKFKFGKRSKEVGAKVKT
jgi:hypothetical protein